MKKLTLLLPIIALLGGCLSVAMTGAQVVYDRHSISTSLHNHNIALTAKEVLHDARHQLPNSRISTASFNYDVLLVGQVPSKQAKETAEALVRQIYGIQHFYNELSIGPPISTWQQIRDSWITTKVKSQYIANNDIDPKAIKVISENGVVYLMGHVKRKQAQRAVMIARRTRGVRKVVRAFRYITLT